MTLLQSSTKLNNKYITLKGKMLLGIIKKRKDYLEMSDNN